jgi:hypothetical protein
MKTSKILFNLLMLLIAGLLHAQDCSGGSDDYENDPTCPAPGDKGAPCYDNIDGVRGLPYGSGRDHVLMKAVTLSPPKADGCFLYSSGLVRKTASCQNGSWSNIIIEPSKYASVVGTRTRNPAIPECNQCKDQNGKFFPINEVTTDLSRPSKVIGQEVRNNNTSIASLNPTRYRTTCVLMETREVPRMSCNDSSTENMPKWIAVGSGSTTYLAKSWVVNHESPFYFCR